MARALAEGPQRHRLEWLPFGFNPSICGREVLIRTANYDLDAMPADWKPDTVNYLYDLDTKARTEVVDRHASSTVFRNGLEDGRMFRFVGRRAALFSGLFHNTSPDGKWVVIRNTMTLIPDLEAPHEVIYYHTNRRREKNWMPLVDDDRLYVLYNTRPWEVCELFPDGSMATVRTGPGLDEWWSGSSNFVPYRGMWLGVLHRRRGEDVKHYYEHAWVLMDGAFGLVDVSPVWHFHARHVELCCGLQWDGEELCLSYGVHDRNAFLLWVGLPGSPNARHSSSNR